MEITVADGRFELDTGGPKASSIRFVSKLETTSQESEEANLQIHGFTGIGPNDPLWRNSLTRKGDTYGVRISAGFNYPASSEIVHDPKITTYGWIPEGYPQTEEPTQTNQTGPLGYLDPSVSLPIVIGALLILIIGVVAIALSFRRREVWVINDDLMEEEEEEVFNVKTRKRDWEELKIG